MLIEKIGIPAMLEQTAEECAELAQACLKMARYLRNENPTPKRLDDIKDHLCEEIADVNLCLDELIDNNIIDKHYILHWRGIKEERISERFKDKDDNNTVLIEGYYQYGYFYEDEEHTKLILPDLNKTYIDKESGYLYKYENGSTGQYYSKIVER